MKLTYLGTAAAEGLPAVFCRCKYCLEAKKLGGKNIRTRSQAIINDDLLIDLPADTYSHFLNNNIEGDKIKYLLVTHSHSDHFYERELRTRQAPFAHMMREEKLKIYCSKGAEKLLQSEPDTADCGIEFGSLNPFEKVKLDCYDVTALPARHFDGDGALFYIISQDGKTILYAHDTGYFYAEVFEYLQNNNVKFDLVSLDCTNVDIAISDEGSHMGIENILRLTKRLEQTGSINKNTKIVINHFSHNANPLQHVLEERVKDYGFLVSYDGMSIEI